REQLPPGAVEMNLIPGLSLKKITALHAALGVASVADLKAAGEKGLIRTVKGFGAKGEAKILAAIDKLESGDARLLLDHATDEAERLLRHVRAAAKADIAGALRRRKESVARIQIVAAGAEPDKLIDDFLRYPAIVHSERAWRPAPWLSSMLFTTPITLRRSCVTRVPKGITRASKSLRGRSGSIWMRPRRTKRKFTAT